MSLGLFINISLGPVFSKAISREHITQPQSEFLRRLKHLFVDIPVFSPFFSFPVVKSSVFEVISFGNIHTHKEPRQGKDLFGFKIKVGVLCPVQQPGSYWDRSSALPLVELKPTEVTAYNKMPNLLLTQRPPRTLGLKSLSSLYDLYHNE